MNPLQSMLASNEPILLDGAMGTMLIAAGLQPGEAPELWNTEHPQEVRAIHRAYIEAGSRLILTNSFGGSRVRLERHGLAERAAELNRKAAENARAEAEAAGRQVLVGGSMGPTGALLQPVGKLGFEEAKAAFAEQAEALAAGGADLLWIETMSDLEEVRAAVEGARSTTDLPLVATLSFDTRGRTMMGVRPSQAAQALAEMGVTAMGANCGTGPEELEKAVAAMREVQPEMFLVAKANAGLPHWVEGEMIYDGTPEVMAAYAQRAQAIGARLIGACCGSSPAHIHAMAQALGQKG